MLTQNTDKLILIHLLFIRKKQSKPRMKVGKMEFAYFLSFTQQWITLNYSE